MTISREQQVNLSDTQYYHCMARCVRRAYLCGEDTISGKNFDHRKQWLVDRFQELASIFAIKICAYAVMSNHYHLVLYVDQDEAQNWSDEEVAERWGKIFKHKSKPSRVDIKNRNNLNEDGARNLSDADIWRDRLCDISWFMRCLNESIARKANKEDQCKGRFWEGRFKSQALMDDGALLACMIYVDLNPIRAKLSKTPEESEFTSIQERIQAYHLREEKEAHKNHENDSLISFKRKEISTQSSFYLPLEFGDYLKLIEWTGKAIKSDQQGAIPQKLAPILERLKLQQEGWLNSSTQFEKCFFYAAGNQENLNQLSSN